MHDHKHAHSHDLSWKHLREHPICIATIVYNIAVVAVEIIIIAAVNHVTFHDLLGYEGILQGIHLLGVILLGFINWWWIHRWSQHHHETRLQTTGKFFSVSTIMFAAHIILLHVLPRWIGFELHGHDHEHSETVEFIVLGGIIIFVTVAFLRRDEILEKLHVKNRFTVSFKKK